MLLARLHSSYSPDQKVIPPWRVPLRLSACRNRQTAPRAEDIRRFLQTIRNYPIPRLTSKKHTDRVEREFHCTLKREKRQSGGCYFHGAATACSTREGASPGQGWLGHFSEIYTLSDTLKSLQPVSSLFMASPYPA